MNTVKLIAMDKLNIIEKIKGTGNCMEREIIYAAQCYKHKVLYIGYTGEQLSERFSKHRCHIKKIFTKVIIQNHITKQFQNCSRTNVS